MTFENLNAPTRELTPEELAMLAVKAEAVAMTVTTDEDTEEAPAEPTLQ